MAAQLRTTVILLIDNKLNLKWGTYKTFVKEKSGDKGIVPISMMEIISLVGNFKEHGWSKERKPTSEEDWDDMWSEAPVSMTHSELLGEESRLQEARILAKLAEVEFEVERRSMSCRYCLVERLGISLSDEELEAAETWLVVGNGVTIPSKLCDWERLDNCETCNC